jgi:hypothetical protein
MPFQNLLVIQARQSRNIHFWPTFLQPDLAKDVLRVIIKKVTDFVEWDPAELSPAFQGAFGDMVQPDDIMSFYDFFLFIL